MTTSTVSPSVPEEQVTHNTRPLKEIRASPPPPPYISVKHTVFHCNKSYGEWTTLYINNEFKTDAHRLDQQCLAARRQEVDPLLCPDCGVAGKQEWILIQVFLLKEEKQVY